MREVFCGVISQELAPYFFMDKEKTCAFFGHRDITITDTLLTVLKNEIEKAVSAGCRIFLFGGFGDFDDLCHQMVCEFQKQRTDVSIQRIFCVPQKLGTLTKRCLRTSFI